MAKVQPTKARHVKKRTTFVRRDTTKNGKLDQNSAWIARSNRQRPPRAESSTFSPSIFNPFQNWWGRSI